MISGKQHSDLELLRLVGKEVRSAWRGLIWVTFLQFFYIPLALLQPLPLKVLADNVIAGNPWPGEITFLISAVGESWHIGVLFVALLTLLIAVLNQVHSILSWTADASFGNQITLRFRTKLFSHLQNLPFSYHDSNQPGDSVFRVNHDSESIKNITLQIVPYFVSLFTIISFFWVLFRINPSLTFIAFSPAPIATFLLVKQRQEGRKIWDGVFKYQSAIFGNLQEVVSAIRLVRAFGREEYELKKFRELGIASAKRQVYAVRYNAILEAMIAITFACGSALIIFFGVRDIQQGTLTFGDLLIFISYSGALYGPLLKLSRASSDLQQHLASANRAFFILEQGIEIPSDKAGMPLVRCAGDFRFDQVSYSHGKDDKTTILEGVNFEIPAGAKVGIHGASGVGKTTLLNLICRFFDPTEGRINLDGVDIRSYKVSDLRNQYSIVHQETLLFSNSILENLKYSNPAASSGEIEAAANAAGIHQFIISLPDGYDTQVGEKGMKLSGGERQRLALARAFLRNAPILILDEPTSSLDFDTEQKIFRSISALMQNRTTFIVSHRHDLFANCDFLIEVRDNHVECRKQR